MYRIKNEHSLLFFWKYREKISLLCSNSLSLFSKGTIYTKLPEPTHEQYSTVYLISFGIPVVPVVLAVPEVPVVSEAFQVNEELFDRIN
jgi:hypothetical protein